MRNARLCLALVCVLVVLVSVAGAQTRRPGLYETTSDINWIQSPLPQGMQMPPGVHSPPGRMRSSYQSCVTQEEIDRYGAILPKPHGECELANVVRGARGLTAAEIADPPPMPPGPPPKNRELAVPPTLEALSSAFE